MSLNSVEVEKYRELRDAVLEGRELSDEQAAIYQELNDKIKSGRDEVTEMSEKDLAGIHSSLKPTDYTEPGRGEWKPEVKTDSDFIYLRNPRPMPTSSSNDGSVVHR